VSDIFLFGAVSHLPLLRTVLGRGLADLQILPCDLQDHTGIVGPDETGLLLQPEDGKTVSGLLVRGLGDRDIARLAYYAGALGKQRKTVTLHPGDGSVLQGQVFFQRPSQQNAPAQGSTGQACSDEGWVVKWGSFAVRVATEVMVHFGHLSEKQIASRLPGIRIRAAAWVAAQARPADLTRDLSRDVVVHAHHHPYSNFFAAQEMDLQYRRFDGTLSPVLNRGAQVLGQAVVVLPYDPARDAVLLVEQFRTPVFIAGDRAPWGIEPVSGLIDPGETPEMAAHRETKEEAGLHLSRLEPVASVYSSSGSSTEFVYIFIGLSDLGNVNKDGGLAEEGEDIRSQVVGFDALMEGIDTQQFCDMPLVTAALWLGRHRDRLRISA